MGQCLAYDEKNMNISVLSVFYDICNFVMISSLCGNTICSLRVFFFSRLQETSLLGHGDYGSCWTRDLCGTQGTHPFPTPFQFIS